MLKICRVCKEPKSIDSFWKKKECTSDGHVGTCAECCGKAKAEYRARPENVETYRESNRQWARKLRLEILNAYGHRCACCGETIAEFLALDHPNNDGASHRAAVGEGTKIYMDVKRRGFPPEFRLLCHNCNQSRGYYGYCPHDNKVTVPIRTEVPVPCQQSDLK